MAEPAFVVAVVALLLAVLLLGARRGLEGLQTAVDRLEHEQGQLRLEVQQGREAALVSIADAAEGLQGEIAHARRALAEVRALEQDRARQLDRATDSLRRLELIVAGSSSRGAAGENVLARALAQLPPDLLETNIAFGGRIVEFALRLPGGRLLPIDSKWTSAAALERLEDPGDAEERRRLEEQIARELRARIREMGKYLDPERTLSLAVLAVPDAVHVATRPAHAAGWREGVLVVPYSLALPFVLVVYRLALHFSAVPEAEELASRLAQIIEAHGRLDSILEGRLSRALAQAGSARDDLRCELATARRAAERLRSRAPEEGAAAPSETV
ncbi:MAG: hypothetical protein A2V74_07485 [Acidobacteria bacterium RBG_16_70_10]|nr:MAG: hypothetical protein A2V74_07485 [Acidobacteria bacterium RBG_16_70_10]